MPGDVLWPAAGEPSRSWLKLSPETRKSFDVALVIAGLIVATLLGVALAIIEALYSPLRIDGWRAPVSLVMALVTNPLLGWFAYVTTRRRMAALLPAAAWWIVWILAAGKTREGDLIIAEGNWVGLSTLFAGSLAFAIGIYVSTMRARPRPAPADQAPPSPAGT